MSKIVCDDAIVWTDAVGTIHWCNASFHQLLDRPRVEVLSARLIDVFPLEVQGTPLTPEQHPIRLLLAGKSEVSGHYIKPPLHVNSDGVV